MTEAWIIDGCRTPRGIGKPGKGALSGIHPQHLGATVLKALAERNDPNIPPASNTLPILISTAFRLRCPIVPDNDDPTI